MKCEICGFIDLDENPSDELVSFYNKRKERIKDRLFNCYNINQTFFDTEINPKWEELIAGNQICLFCLPRYFYAHALIQMKDLLDIDQFIDMLEWVTKASMLSEREICVEIVLKELESREVDSVVFYRLIWALRNPDKPTAPPSEVETNLITSLKEDSNISERDLAYIFDRTRHAIRKVIDA